MALPALVADYWPSVVAFLAFGAAHSLGAQDGFKSGLERVAGAFFVEHLWRLVYCVLSFAALYHVVTPLHWDGNPDANVWLVEYPEWLWRAVVVAHLGSIAILYAAFVQSDYLEFWGVKQAWRGVRRAFGRPSPDPAPALFGTDRLETGGLYGWVRHPMLSGGLLFLLTSGPSRNNLVFLAMYTSYMLIGGWFEERRLLRVFGEDYERYRREVGAFVPRPRRFVAALRRER